MQALLDVILPVFFVIGAGYLAVWAKWFPGHGVDMLMKFTQSFAIPALLFQAISSLDLGQEFNLPLLSSYYIGSICAFCLALFGARTVFRRTWEDSIAIGFCCLFSNAVLLGLPITERAYGPDALAGNYAIIALNAPISFAIGMTLMEIARNLGGGLVATVQRILKAIFANSLIIALTAGITVNVTGIAVPAMIWDGLSLLSGAALPAALFGLGGVLVQYRPEGDTKTVAMVIAISLTVHPAITWSLGKGMGLDTDAIRSAVLTASMPPGANAYIFASIYMAARRVAATAVLAGTAVSILTASFWLEVLP